MDPIETAKLISVKVDKLYRKIVPNAPISPPAQKHMSTIISLSYFDRPLFEDHMAQREFEAMGPDSDGHVHFDGFSAWLQTNGEFPRRLKMRCVRTLKLYSSGERIDPTPRQVFDSLGGSEKGYLKSEVVRRCLGRASLDSPALYVLDSICLASFSIAGAESGIIRGLPPLACSALGVTMCFGGIARDLITKRDVSLGAEHFAFATGCGAATYVGLRQLMLNGILPLSLPVRTGAAMCTVFGIRWLAWRQLPEPLLLPMFEMKAPSEWLSSTKK